MKFYTELTLYGLDSSLLNFQNTKINNQTTIYQLLIINELLLINTYTIMKKLLVIIFSSIILIGCKSKNPLHLRYGNDNNSITIFSDSLEFLYKNPYSKKIKINSFSRNKKHIFSDLYIDEKDTLHIKAYLKEVSKPIDCKKNTFSTEKIFPLKNNKELVLLGQSKRKHSLAKIDSIHILPNYKDFLSSKKELPWEIDVVLNQFLYQDYEIQNRLIIDIFGDKLNTNSLLGTTLIDNYNNLNDFELGKHIIVKRKKKTIEKDSNLVSIEHFIEQAAQENDILLFNEHHSYPHTRYNFMQTLSKLKNEGFSFLALEGITSPKGNTKISEDIATLSGYYLQEPTYSLMVYYAVSLGYQIVAYEDNTDCETDNCRDSIQAINIARIYKKDPKAKIVALAGHAHIEKGVRNNRKFMRSYLDQLLPQKKILSISQTQYISTNLDEEDILIEKPHILNISDNQNDAYVISPFYKEYYSWITSPNDLMSKKINIKPMDNKAFYIEVLPLYEEKELKYPIYRTNILKKQSDYIYIPENIKLKIIYKDKNNKRL